ncbi:MAG TPA: ArsA family ATPase [Ktedonobacteraceae bacterium]|nr:ArsA family ATPase [Ktedonobacteraceae bacterium]
MALINFAETSFQFILFGGKGGVGKTTMAAATALELAQENKVLLFTTDPAPSLADSFGQAIGSEPTAIVGARNLFAMELDAGKVLDEFKKEHGQEILTILQQGTYLANQETEALFRLDFPGMDEVMSLKKIVDFMEHSDYQRYVVDTAPTGHTLRFLMLPDMLDNWIKLLARLRWKYHAISRQFARADRIEKADEFLLDMKKTVSKVRALLQNAEKTEFVVVTIAEKMAVSETEALLRGLKHLRIPSRHMIINNIFPREDGGFAEMRRKTQERYIQAMKEKFSAQSITEVMLQPTDIQGIDSLQQLGTQLFHPGVGADLSRPFAPIR